MIRIIMDNQTVRAVSCSSFILDITHYNPGFKHDAVNVVFHRVINNRIHTIVFSNDIGVTSCKSH